MHTANVHLGGKVNNRAVYMVGKSLDAAGVDKKYLFEGLPYTHDACPEWIPWQDWVQIIDRLAEECETDEGLRDAGLHVFKAPSAIFLLRLVGFFADLGSMLVRMNELIMRAFFKGIRFETNLDKKNRICEAKIIIPEELKACRSFLVMSSAAYEAIFQQLKVPYDDFHYTCTDRTAVYSFRYRESQGIFARFRHTYRVIVGADYAVKQIAANEAELRRRLEIVEAAIKEAEMLREKERHARELAEEALQVRQRFLAIMSHELRTPLNHIIGCASILSSESLHEEQYEYVDIIHRSSYNLLDLIELVLDFTSAGNLSSERPQDISLADLLDPIIEHARHASKKKDLKLVYPELVADQAPSYKIFVGHVRRILKLLIDNAIKFTHTGTVELAVQRADDGMLNLYIKDTGIGVPSDWEEEIFEPFRAVDSSDTRQVGGIGLGLTIAQKLAREIGGDLVLEESSSEGSTFMLSVPIDAQLDDPLASELSTGKDANDPSITPL